ncbi:MAG: hypothetical protein R3F53_12405 [Gammaproteobacteria bacterium]
MNDGGHAIFKAGIPRCFIPAYDVVNDDDGGDAIVKAGIPRYFIPASVGRIP